MEKGKGSRRRTSNENTGGKEGRQKEQRAGVRADSAPQASNTHQHWAPQVDAPLGYTTPTSYQLLQQKLLPEIEKKD